MSDRLDLYVLEDGESIYDRAAVVSVYRLGKEAIALCERLGVRKRDRLPLN